MQSVIAGHLVQFWVDSSQLSIILENRFLSVTQKRDIWVAGLLVGRSLSHTLYVTLCNAQKSNFLIFDFFGRFGPRSTGYTCKV